MIYNPEKIRNIAVVGHQGSGKTTLVESIAFKGGLISQKGTVEAKNTLSDFLPDEQKKLTSVSTAVIPVNYKDYKLNLIDLPGNDDFVYETIGVSRLIKGAVLVIDASKGVQIGAVKNFRTLKKRGVPMFIYVNKMDKENIDFPALYEEIKTKLDKKCVPFLYPLGESSDFSGYVRVANMTASRYNGKECIEDTSYEEKREAVFELQNKLVETVATTDDALLDKYFAGETLTLDEITNGLRKAVLDGELYPIMVGSATKDIGTLTLLDMFINYLPSPADLKPILADDGNGNEIEVKTSNEADPSLCVFKNSYDTYQGLICVFKVNSGVIRLGDELYCPNNNQTYKLSTLFSVCGKKLTPVTEISAGDIGAFTKLENIKLSYTLCSPKKVIHIKEVHYPGATYTRAIVPTSKNDSDKLFPIVEKMMLEDPTISFEKNAVTNQILIGSLSSSHLQYILDKIKEVNKINFTLETPKIVYRETITCKADSEGRYVKQSGGSGHYGVVFMSFEPSDKNEFQSTVFGGHIDKGYFPAVEKGFYEALEHGGLIGAPVINVKATLTDGKQHPVDSDELAFRNAGILAFKEAYAKCKPILLEPYDRLKVQIESDYLGAILSDLSKRRGKILSTDEDGEGNMVVVALVPEAEILEYTNELKSLTKGTGFFNLEFEDYERVPGEIADEVIKAHKEAK